MEKFFYQWSTNRPHQLSFSDQFAFWLGSSTTAALIALLNTITEMLRTNAYVVVIALDFSKAFDTVKHSTLTKKMALLDMPDCVYNWVVSFLVGHSHRTVFGVRE